MPAENQWVGEVNAYYRLEFPVFLSPKTSLGIDNSWRYMRFALYGDKAADANCLYSDIYFYDMEDGQMLPHFEKQ